MRMKQKEQYFEVGHRVYRVVEDLDDYKAFGLGDHGEQVEVSSGRIMASGIPISKDEYNAEVRAAKARKKTSANVPEAKQSSTRSLFFPVFRCR